MGGEQPPPVKDLFCDPAIAQERLTEVRLADRCERLTMAATEPSFAARN
jgi:hypothetical protein